MRATSSVLLMALLAVSVSVAARPLPEDLLQQAETSRSSNPAKLVRLLDQLHQRDVELTPAQRQQLAYLQAYQWAFTGQYESAIARLKQLNLSAPDLDTRFRAGALLVNIYAKTRNFAEGLRQLGSTLQYIERIDNAELRVHALTEAAYIHNEVGQYRLGMHYADRILKSNPTARARCFAHYLQFDAMLNLNILPPDDAPITRAIDDCVAINEIILANSIRTTLARKWVRAKKREEAITLLRKYLTQVEASGYPFLVVQFKSLLAELMFERGDLHVAETFASETVTLSTTVGNTYALVTAYHTLYRIAERRDDDETALVYYRRFAEADKAFLNEVKARELAYQMVRQETMEKSQQIQRLDNQNQLLLLQRRLEAQSSQNNRLMMILLLVLLLSLLYWAYRTKRTQVSFKRLAQTDMLTGVCNRSHFTEQAEHRLAQCERARQTAVLVMFDLDHFKAINDRHGHAVGDRVLRLTAEISHEFSSQMDTFGRLGGEEFAFLISRCTVQQAIELAEAYRLRIAQIQIPEPLTVTASFGVVSTHQMGYQLAHLMSCADKMLYRSKHEGRDRVTVFENMSSVPVVRTGQETGIQRHETGAGLAPMESWERLGT